ncbi:MAG: DnaA regulatory inactivator Hda [Neisseria sp.]|uniref:DnaA regulatory inactivator Hda n=1 Tax=Neisseria sp. TaxID=192066 RepID=UPI0026DCC7E9|nr:DnaA regulatory inactivator Hda [Neisseria sp.]MDO4641549.1 DnaA regulatory inactivator Hda [Neisseria sp.]
MNQLIFDFASHEYPGFDEFLGVANSELVHVLKEQENQFLYVWGSEGSGKSHLLRAWADKAARSGARALYIDARKQPLTQTAYEADYLAVDQIECLDAEEQSLLFAIFNQYRNSKQGSLLLSADVKPQHLCIREDLRTRMAYCLVYEVKPLSDEEKISALTSIARTRRIPVDSAVFHYLLLHWKRDLGSLMNMLDALDHYSLTMKKRITVPLLRQLLQQQETE